MIFEREINGLPERAGSETPQMIHSACPPFPSASPIFRGRR